MQTTRRTRRLVFVASLAAAGAFMVTGDAALAEPRPQAETTYILVDDHGCPYGERDGADL